MEIKVGNKVFSGAEEPVMVILDDQDKKNIVNMLPHCKHYCMYPSEEFTEVDIKVWMKKI